MYIIYLNPYHLRTFLIFAFKHHILHPISGRKSLPFNRYQHLSHTHLNLHWLPIKYRILFKVLVLTFKALDGTGPEYIRDLLSFHTPSRTLRSSSDTLLLQLPRTKLKTYGDKSFSVLVPAEWNKLPISIRSSLSLFSFKSMLKTHFFKLHYLSF